VYATVGAASSVLCAQTGWGELHLLMNDAERDRMLNDMFDALVVIKVMVEELMRRIPEPRCGYCGMGRGWHHGGVDHEFVF
jgi:hypothetical protein